MSKQQDELREQIHILLVDYDRAGMWQGNASKEIMKLVNSEVRTALDRVWTRLDYMTTANGTLKFNDTVSVIEEVRKDYE